MKYLWTTINVRDLEKSVAFYENIVGLKQEARFSAGPGTEIAFMVSEGTETKLELICSEDFKGQPSDIAMSFGFATENARKKREEVIGKGFEASPIISPNPDTEFFFIQDPDGLDIQFVQE